MHFTQYAMACILALPSLTLSAPLPTIPNDASPLGGRDPKFVTNLNHFSSTSGHAPFSAPKPARAVDAGLDIERRNPGRYRTIDNAPPVVSTGLRPLIDAFNAGSPSSGVASGKGGAKGPKVEGPKRASPKPKKGKRDVGAGEALEARRVEKVVPNRRPGPDVCRGISCNRDLPHIPQSVLNSLGKKNPK